MKVLLMFQMMCVERINLNNIMRINIYHLTITDEVQVTCLKYIPQIGTLAVGYNFGAFQLWRLYNPALE